MNGVPENNLKFSIIEKQNYSILKISGELIGPVSTQLNHELKNISLNTKYIIVDISELRYMCSAGSGILLSYVYVLRKKGGDILLSGINKDIEKIIKLVKFNEIFKSFDSVENAEKYVWENLS